MRAAERVFARRQLDKRLNMLRNAEELSRPPRGWVRAIREALGMTAAQLAKRMGVTQPRIATLEQAEARGAITLETLEAAARALDCRLVYALVPRQPLDVLVEERARRLAQKRIEAISHSMALEAQRVDHADESVQGERLVRQLVEKAGSELWEENT